jgi:hypothetical protein
MAGAPGHRQRSWRLRVRPGKRGILRLPSVYVPTAFGGECLNSFVSVGKAESLAQDKFGLASSFVEQFQLAENALWYVEQTHLDPEVLVRS